jgi:HlyD family secretion protein
MNLKNFFSYKSIALIILVLLIGIYFYYKYYSSTKTASVTPVYKKAEKNLVKSSISASGNIATANYLAVTTSVNGIIKDVYVKEGDVVKAGQKASSIKRHLNAAEGK